MRPVRSSTLACQAFSKLRCCTEQRAIHHHQSGIEALHHAGEFVDFAFSDKRRRMNFVEQRHPRLDHVKLDRPGETDGLIEPCS